MKLELKHLAPYLPYGLELYGTSQETFSKLISLSESHYTASTHYYKTPHSNKTFERPEIKSRIEFCKPLLYPLSTITEDKYINSLMDSLGYSKSYRDTFDSFKHNHTKNSYSIIIKSPIEIEASIVIRNGIVSKSTKYSIMEWLFENHFDVLGIIENNLAIDKSTINK